MKSVIKSSEDESPIIFVGTLVSVSFKQLFPEILNEDCYFIYTSFEGQDFRFWTHFRLSWVGEGGGVF